MHPPRLNDFSGLHLEPTNICTLKCPGCPRTRFIDQWPTRWRNHSLDIDQLLEFLDVDLRGIPVSLCGNYGDPIYHPKFHEFIQGLKSRGSHLSIFTNGSYRDRSWWRRTQEILDTNDRIIFSIDGTPENFTEYRINGDWPSIKVAIEECVQGPASTTWKYIPFLFNQSNIDQVRDLSVSMGIDHFRLERSDRFDEKTQHLKPNDEWVNVEFQHKGNWQKTSSSAKISPKCILKNTYHYISANGHYSSCCFVADHRFYYKNVFGKKQKEFSIAGRRFSDMIGSLDVMEFFHHIEDRDVCQFNCSADHS